MNLLRILFIEDLPSDVELAVHELRKDKLKFEHTTVCTQVDLIKALNEFRPDLIISDYMMPAYNGLQALRDVKKFDKSIPFILYTGSINEETAVECIKAGADDYVIKEHMARLPFAVKDALEQLRIKKEKRDTDLLLKESVEHFRTLYNNVPIGLYRTSPEGKILLANHALIKMLGFRSFDEMAAIDLNKTGIGTTNQRQKFIDQIEKEGVVKDLEAIWICSDGKEINVRENARLIRDPEGKILYYDGTVEDITERKKAEKELISSYSILNASLESTADGILIADGKGGIIKWNNKFAQMWRFPENILDSHDDNAAINHVLNQLIDPDKFLAIVKDLYTNPEKLSFDKLEFKDGRVFERYSQPQKIDNSVVGRVWSFRDVTDRYYAEESLKLSEEKFRSIAENLSDIIFLTDYDGIIKYISPSVRTFGYDPEECIGKFFGEFLAEGELEKAMPVFINTLSSNFSSATTSLIVKRKDGSNFFAELAGSVFEAGNESTGILGLLRDVSDKMNREIELRKLSRVVEQSPASIVITDTDGIIEYVNPKLCEITGYSKKELIGANPNIMSSKEKAKEEYKILWDTIKSGNDWKGEFHNKKKNGELYWESASVSPIKNEKNEITHFLGIKEDITLRKILEAKTLSSELRYRELFLNNPVPLYIFDENTLEFVEVNDAAVQDYGYSREDFASMTLKDIRLSEDIPGLLESITKLGSNPFNSTSMRHRKKDGTVFPVEITSHSLPEKNSRKTRLVMAVDITERLKAAELMKLAKEKAEASDKLKTSFLNNISHEIRTPMNGILGFAEIMAQSDLSEGEKRDSISMLHESCDSLMNTITNYMDISLITSGNMSFFKKDFIPGQLLRKIFNRYKTICSNKNLELLLSIPEQSENLSINTDPEIFQKIINHLLNNSIKFTEKGSINYGFVIHEGKIEFFVKDTGIGIRKESIKGIFDNFVKEDLSPSRLTEGSGLGLSIAKGMIEIIGGNIRAESELGLGSCFSFTIPLLNDNKIVLSGTYGIENKKINSGASILVAEDEETNFFYLNVILKRETGAKVLHASNGREAIELFKANPDIILVLMDIKMPEIDGLEATRQIKLINQDIPVIAITAYAMTGDEERILAAGCDGYLSKPIGKKILLDKMAEFIEI
jgi:PAS domain S-box-containing protein